MGKLIRDRIPRNVADLGVKLNIRILTPAEYVIELKRKLVEEANEVLAAKTNPELYEEVADVLEVLEALIQAEDMNEDAIRFTKAEKHKSNGGFRDRIYLND